MNLSTALLVSASLLSPFKQFTHGNKPASPDQRVEFTLHNASHSFEDLEVDGRVYTVPTNQNLIIKAPAGTTIYAASRFDNFRRGDAVLTVTASLKESHFDVR